MILKIKRSLLLVDYKLIVSLMLVQLATTLYIVCFGLNDVNGPLEEYIDSLRKIFEKALASEAEVVFMTPNMLNPCFKPLFRE